MDPSYSYPPPSSSTLAAYYESRPSEVFYPPSAGDVINVYAPDCSATTFSSSGEDTQQGQEDLMMADQNQIIYEPSHL